MRYANLLESIANPTPTIKPATANNAVILQDAFAECAQTAALSEQAATTSNEVRSARFSIVA